MTTMSNQFWLRLALVAAILALLLAPATGAAPASAEGTSPTVLGVAVTPENPSVLYVLAAGPTLGEDPLVNPDALRLYRLFQSVDHGANWTVVPMPGLQYQRPEYFTVDYARPNNLYVAGLLGVLHAERGQIWEQLNTQPLYARAVQVDPADPTHLLAATLGGPVVQHSRDGGRTWTPLGLYGNAGANLLLTPDGKKLYAVSSNAGAGGANLYRGTPDGAAWTRLDTPTPYFRGLAYDPTGDALYLSTTYGAGATSGAIYRLKDGAWQMVKDFGASHADVVAVDAQSPKTIYALVEGRLLSSADDGKSWSPITLPQIAWPIPVADGLRAYYRNHDGWRVMGRPLSDATIQQTTPAQYFEKGRLEDHTATVSEPNWRYMYGLLVDELQNAQASLPVGGDASTITYAGLHLYARPEARVPMPAVFGGGVQRNPDTSIFVPYHAQLAPAAGHNVAPQFWAYINRADLFPGGWLHDIGLPMTEPIAAVVDKGLVKGRSILIQAFQRTVLTFDPLNPRDWQVERANVGTDYWKVFPDRVR